MNKKGGKWQANQFSWHTRLHWHTGPNDDKQEDSFEKWITQNEIYRVVSMHLCVSVPVCEDEKMRRWIGIDNKIIN